MEPTEEEIETFKNAWHQAEPGDRVRSGLKAVLELRDAAQIEDERWNQGR